MLLGIEVGIPLLKFVRLLHDLEAHQMQSSP